MADKRKLTDLEYELLISEVHSRICLWNDRHNDFKNSAVTKKLWEEVGQAINLPGEECKKKWKNLKDSFRKKIQTAPAKSSASPPHKKWKFATLMEFTRDVLPSPMVGNIQSPSIEEEEKEEEDSTIYLATAEYSDPDLSQQQDTISMCPEVNDRFSRFYGNIRKTEMGILESEERKINGISNVGKENDDDKGDDYHFFLSLLPYVTRLDSLEKLQLRTKILNCVFEATKDHEERKLGEQFSPHVSVLYSSSNDSS